MGNKNKKEQQLNIKIKQLNELIAMFVGLCEEYQRGHNGFRLGEEEENLYVEKIFSYYTFIAFKIDDLKKIKNNNEIVYSNTEEPISKDKILSFDEKYRKNLGGFETIKRISRIISSIFPNFSKIFFFSEEISELKSIYFASCFSSFIIVSNFSI